MTFLTRYAVFDNDGNQLIIGSDNREIAIAASKRHRDSTVYDRDAGKEIFSEHDWAEHKRSERQ